MYLANLTCSSEQSLSSIGSTCSELETIIKLGEGARSRSAACPAFHVDRSVPVLGHIHPVFLFVKKGIGQSSWIVRVFGDLKVIAVRSAAFNVFSGNFDVSSLVRILVDPLCVRRWVGLQEFTLHHSVDTRGTPDVVVPVERHHLIIQIYFTCRREGFTDGIGFHHWHPEKIH